MDNVSAFLVGLPNAGKSTLFNHLTGKSRKVSNYSGITTDLAIADIKDSKTQLIDLPGITSLSPLSPDEAVSVSSLLGCTPNVEAQAIFFVLDLARLTPSVSLCLEIVEMFPGKVIAIINKDDQQEISPNQINHFKEQLGCPVISLSCHQQQADSITAKITESVKLINLEGSLKPAKVQVITNSSLTHLPGLSNSSGQLVFEVEKTQDEVLNYLVENNKRARKIALSQLMNEKKKKSHSIDTLVLNPWLGPLLFFGVFLFIFTALFSWASPFMDAIDSLFGFLSDTAANLIAHELLSSLITDGVLAGVGGVVIFLPQIMILFFLLSLLEQSGYIARASLLTDKVMSFFGLSGKAFLPFLSGFACSIPGIMAARAISDRKERIVTMITLPLITCSARLPVYILIVGTFIPDRTVFGFFNLQGLSFFILYFLGPLSALIMAKIFRLSLFKGKASDFVMDLPDYQTPSLWTAIKHSFQKGMGFLKKAGTVILGFSLLIWALSTFPRVKHEATTDLSPEQVQSIQLEKSALGVIGKTIEPVLRPIGMDWKMGIGLLVSLGARELFVSALGTVYALGDVDEESSNLQKRLLSEKDQLGKPSYNLGTAWSILLFFVFSLQCTSTLAVLRKETGSWKTPMYTFAYLFALAYFSSFVVYQTLST